MYRQALSIALAILLIWHGWAWAASPFMTGAAASNEEIEFERSIQNLDRLARELRPNLDRSQFELDALLERLDYEPKAIVRFVTEEIGLEVYPGALRGARGTLLSRAGNALDQALLLATLLKDTGQEVVIHRGTLSEARADSLVEKMAGGRALAPSMWLEEPASRSSSSSEISDSSSRRAAWIRAARGKSDRLAGALEQAGVELGSPAVMDQIRQEARDYYWVEFRLGPGAAWQSAHPVLGEDPAIEPTSTFSGEIPTELTHRIIVELLVATRLGSRTEVSPLMAPIEFASANLNDPSLTITLVPDQLLNQNGPLDPEAIADKTRFLLPNVNGKLPEDGKALSLRGLLVPVDALAMGAAGVFETASEKGSQAIGALSGLSSKSKDPEPVAIEAVRIKVTFRAPGGAERVAVRELFDEQRDLTPEARRAKEPGPDLVRAIARNQTLVFATGSYHEGFVLDSLLAQAESLESLWEAAGALDPDGCETLSCLSELEWEAPEIGPSLAMLYLAFDGVFGEQQGGSDYRHTPNLVRVTQPLLARGADEAQSRVDIISNARRVLQLRDGRLEPAPDALMLAGVWETQIETDLLALGSDSPMPATEPSDLRLYSKEELTSASGGSGPAKQMLRDIELGYLVLADGDLDLDAATNEFRWWRIERESGETLGMTVYGGAVTVEMAGVLIIAFLVLQIVNLGLIAWCMSEDGSLPTCVVCGSAPLYLFAGAIAMLEAFLSNALDPVGYFQEEFELIQRWCEQSAS